MLTDFEVRLRKSLNEARNLTAAQKNILDQFIKSSNRQQIVDAIVDTESASFFKQIERISDHETLISDVQRYLGDNGKMYESKTDEPFKLNLKLDSTGSHLMKELPGLKTAGAKKAFGKGNDGPEPEKGYDGPEYIFVSRRGKIFTLYPRHHVWRIGTVNASNADVAEFEEWVLAKVK